MGRAWATTNSRLSADDWIQAGFAILTEEGTKALKLDRLCARLGVTKGSFYWQFTDMAGYRAALVQAWGEWRDDDRRHFCELSGLPPRDRLSELMSSLVSERHWTLEPAMRERAHTRYEGPTDRNGVKGNPMADDTRDRVTNFFQKRMANPLMRLMPFQTLLETTGRKSGEPRRTPLGGSRVGDQFWFVSEFGEKSQYVKNIKANLNVRVRLRGRWHKGVAHLVPDDDPHARLKSLPQMNSFGVRTFGTNLLTIRVDLTD
jgi:deazaflavin-dependent oxidoreductase (nitroreductase family)